MARSQQVNANTGHYEDEDYVEDGEGQSEDEVEDKVGSRGESLLTSSCSDSLTARKRCKSRRPKLWKTEVSAHTVKYA